MSDPDVQGLVELAHEEAGIELPAQDAPADDTKTNTPEPKAPDTNTEAESAPAPTETKEPAKAEPETADKTKTEPLQTESSQEPNTKTETESAAETVQSEAEAVKDWKATLPPPPPEFSLPAPQVDPETGQITNYSPQQYEDYIVQKAEQRLQERNYQQTVENRALDAAEKILPSIKTDPKVRQLVENQRIAQVVNGQDSDTVTAALAIKELLGGTQEQLAKAKAEGAASAKTSIEVQQRSAVESGAGTTPDTDQDSNEQLAARINANEPDAFIELMDKWQKDGLV